MTLVVEQRPSDSPYIDQVMWGWSASAGSACRPAETHWHMVFLKHRGQVHPLLVGPWSSAGPVQWGAGGELLWIRFKLGTFMPNIAARTFLNTELELPGGAGQSFWLNSATWQFPNPDNVETFVNRLVRDEVLLHDPLVPAVLRDEPHDAASRTVRYRFQRATGLTQTHVRQHQRAHEAVALLQQGVPILDVVFHLGYFDQPHLTRSLKRIIGTTPAQYQQQPAEPLVRYNAAAAS